VIKVSNEMIMALCALATALAGLLVFVWRGGQLAQQLETAKTMAEDLSKELKEVRAEFKSEVDVLSEKIDGLTRMIYELRGARGRKGGLNDIG
jgi:hypothetical protein